MKQENKNTTKQSVKTDKTERPTSTAPKTLQSHQPNKLLNKRYKLNIKSISCRVRSWFCWFSR